MKVDGSEERPKLGTGAAWMLAGAATLTMAVSYFDRHTLAVIAPTVRGALKIDNRQYGIVVSMFSVAYLIGSPIAGRVVDRVGARRALIVAVVAWSVVAATQSLAFSFGALLVMRVALGLAESPSFPGASQTITRAIPPPRRALAFGLLFTGSSLGALVASLLAPRLSARFGWQSAFLLTAVAGLVWIPMWLFVTRSPAARATLDRPAEIARLPPPPFYATLTSMPVLRAVVVVLATAPVANFVLNWSVPYLSYAEHVGEKDIGKYAWIPPVLFDVGSIAFGYLATRGARSRVGGSPTGLFLLAGVLASSLPLLAVLRGPWAAATVAGVAIAGVGGLFAILTAEMLSRVPPNAVSTAGGITAAAQSLAYVIANPLVGWAVDVSKVYTGTVIFLSALVLPAAVVWIAWAPRGPTKTPR